MPSAVQLHCCRVVAPSLAVAILAAVHLVSGGSNDTGVFGDDGGCFGAEDETSLLQMLLEPKRASERIHQRKAVKDLQSPSSVPHEQVSVHAAAPVIKCNFMVRDVVDSVYYNGEDITSSVKGKLDDWYVDKTVTLSGLPGAYLVITGHSFKGGCSESGLQIVCSNGASSDSGWEVAGSNVPLSPKHTAGSGTSWGEPCNSSASILLPGDPMVQRIWSANTSYVAFRSKVFLSDVEAAKILPQPTSPKVVTCQFSVNDAVDAVYYNRKDITSSVSGDMSSWPITKEVTVDVVPNAYFVVLGHKKDEGSCSTGGFMIYCSNGITTRSGWEVYNTSESLSLEDLHRLGVGDGWHLPCDSGTSVSLDDRPEIPKIFASDEKYAAFRIRLAIEAIPSAAATTQSSPSYDVAAQISAGNSHTCQLSQAGLARCWGRNSTDGRTMPPSDVGPYTGIDAGYATTCGITTDGQVYCWGDNAEGQAAPDNGMGPFQSVSVGRIHACGIRSADSFVLCWGSSASLIGSPPPAAKYKQLSVSSFHSCAIRVADNNAECWGLNSVGQASPPQREANHYSHISAGEQHTCALRLGDSAVVCWGADDSGQASAPPGAFKSVSAGGYTTCALSSSGEIQCWGDDSDGQASPPSGDNFEAISVGYAHACALSKADGNATAKVYCWGRNTYGQATPNASWSR
jgi:hypothetical protein